MEQLNSYTPSRDVLEGLPPEESLCLLLARKTFQTAFPEEHCTRLVKAVCQRSGWGRVMELAFQTDICPLLFYHLSRLRVEGVPDEVLWGIGTLTRYNEKRCLTLREELCRLLDSFRGRGLRVVPFRGVVLAQELYEEPSLRVVRDIDLLVPRGEAVQAIRLLRELGYKLEVDDAFFERFILSSSHSASLVRQSQKTSFLVDLHWDLTLPSFGVPALPLVFWQEGLEEGQIWGKKVLNTKPEWTLLFVTLHAFHHHYSQLKGLVDLNELCARPTMTWDVVAEVAGRYGWTEAVKLSLTVCHRLFGTNVPKAFLLDALPSWVKLFPFTSSSWPIKGPKRLHYLGHLLWPTQTDYQFLPLPPLLSSLYFILRPIRGTVTLLYRILIAGLKALTKGR